jgi:hypothetical protein
MAHGFSCLKEMFLDKYAEVFVKDGLGVLVYDNRCFGASDGEPRQEIDPMAQVRDYQHAITFARTLPEVDKDRIGIWGTSYTGGHVLIAGAIDKRVKCVVSQRLTRRWLTADFPDLAQYSQPSYARVLSLIEQRSSLNPGDISRRKRRGVLRDIGTRSGSGSICFARSGRANSQPTAARCKLSPRTTVKCSPSRPPAFMSGQKDITTIGDPSPHAASALVLAACRAPLSDLGARVLEHPEAAGRAPPARDPPAEAT